MAASRARLNRNHQDSIRQKIRGSMLVMGIQRYAMSGEFYDGKVRKFRVAAPEDAPLLALRLKAGIALLNKLVPDMHELSGPNGGPIPVEAISDPLEIARRIAFALISGAQQSSAQSVATPASTTEEGEKA